MSGDIGDRRQFRIVYEFTSEFIVCDNKWHRIQVMYDKDEVTMMVDQAEVKQELKRNNFFLSSSMDAPLYIGGLPGELSQTISLG